MAEKIEVGVGTFTTEMFFLLFCQFLNEPHWISKSIRFQKGWRYLHYLLRPYVVQQVGHQLEGDADVLAEVESHVLDRGSLSTILTRPCPHRQLRVAGLGVGQQRHHPTGVGHEAGTLVVTLVQVQGPRILLTTATAQGDSSEQTCRL